MFSHGDVSEPDLCTSEDSRFSANGGRHGQVAVGERVGGRLIGVFDVCCWVGAGVGKEVLAGGTLPGFSGDQARQAVEGEVDDRLIGGARRQVDLDLPLQFDNPRGDLDQA